MVTIYQNYADEPKDVFFPLPEQLACDFYALEMDSYTADIIFFEKFLPQQGNFLELGCGTGRIARKLSIRDSLSRFIVGIDISIPMLRLAARKQHPSEHSPCYICMDMLHLAFSLNFDAILIPYNTLNLLCSEEAILQCLQCCRHFLQPGGKIFVQIFVPTDDFIRRKKTFQFQMFNQSGGGRIIKEIVKHYQPQSQSVQIEERYRVRPGQKGEAKEDWNSIYTIAGFPADKWFSIFRKAGFTQTETYGDYLGSPYNKLTTSTLLAILTL